MSNRYDNAATVSDEHGKGVEILRTVTKEFSATAASNTPVFEAEVDLVVRFVRVRNLAAGTPSAGTYTVTRKKAGSTEAATQVATGDSLDPGSNYGSVEVPVTHRTRVRKGDVILVTKPDSTTAVAVDIGWMPDMFGFESNPRTF